MLTCCYLIGEEDSTCFKDLLGYIANIENYLYIILFFCCLFLFFKTGFLCTFGACPGTSSCRPGWPWTQRSACLCLLSAGIKDICHFPWPGTWFLSSGTIVIDLFIDSSVNGGMGEPLVRYLLSYPLYSRIPRTLKKEKGRCLMTQPRLF